MPDLTVHLPDGAQPSRDTAKRQPVPNGRATLSRVTITCPRPRNRARDEFHLRPDRIAQTVSGFYADATLTMTRRTITFQLTSRTTVTEISSIHSALASILSCLMLEIEHDSRYRGLLPKPVRTTVEDLADEIDPQEVGR